MDRDPARASLSENGGAQGIGLYVPLLTRNAYSPIVDKSGQRFGYMIVISVIDL